MSAASCAEGLAEGTGVARDVRVGSCRHPCHFSEGGRRREELTLTKSRNFAKRALNDK